MSVVTYLDTTRKIDIVAYLDTTRKVNIVTRLDTTRQIKTPSIPFTINADTCRITSLPIALNADTCRKTCKHVDVNADTCRVLTDKVITPFIINADTKRTTCLPITVNADTCRKTHRPFVINADTKRKLLSNMQYKSINITISSKTLTDKFSIQTYDKVNIDQLYNLQIKDLSCIFKALETSETDQLTNVQGTYDIDEILTKRIIRNTTDYKAIGIINDTIKVLGKTANVNIDEFYPRFISGYATGQEVLSALFGWTDKIPNRLIHVYMRGNTINVIQRGKELSVLPLTKYAAPTINRKRIKTMQDQTDSAGQSSASKIYGAPPHDPSPDKNENYLSGTFTNGDSSITYSSGLVTEERHKVGDFTEVTTQQYSSSRPPAYLTRKTTITQIGKVVVDYVYSNEKLATEIEAEYTGSEITRKRTTRHYPLGQGMWGTSIEEDGETTYGGISQGAPGGKASPFNIQNESKSTNWSSGNLFPPELPIIAPLYAKYAKDYPVCDNASLQMIADALMWLNNKIEKTVTLESYDETIFDFSSRILWQGEEYFLVSNNISHEPEKFVQKVEMIRWD